MAYWNDTTGRTTNTVGLGIIRIMVRVMPHQHLHLKPLYDPHFKHGPDTPQLELMRNKAI